MVRTLLGTAVQFGTQLGAVLEQTRETVTALNAARAQVAPHPIDATEVGAHAECRAQGCAQCAGSGVAQASTGEPFTRRGPVSLEDRLALLQAAQRERQRKLAQIRKLADLFGQVAAALASARQTALALEAELRALCK